MKKKSAIFEPIDHETVVDSVTHQIENLIVTGVLKEGAKLPSEREMADAMDVSRPKIREALQRLEELKLVVVKHGEGSFVGPIIGSAMNPALINLISRNQAAFYDYLEYRREQEAFAARLAATRATNSDKEIIRYLLAEHERAHLAGEDKVAKKADIDFHAAIVDACHNTMMIHTMASIYELTHKGVFYNPDFLLAVVGSGDELIRQHKLIGFAVLEERAEDAAQAAWDHIDFVEQSFRKSNENLRREFLSQKRLAVVSGD